MRAKVIPQDGGGSYYFVNMPRTAPEWCEMFKGNSFEPIFLKRDLVLLAPDSGEWSRNTTATETYKAWLDQRGIMLRDGFIQGDVVVLDTAGCINEWRNRLNNESHASYHIRRTRLMHKSDKARAAKYGLTMDQYVELIRRPCEICGDPRASCIDHDHETGKVRGHLCYRCNTTLGAYERFIREKLVFKVFEYLTRSGLSFSDRE